MPIIIKSPREIEFMRKAGKLTAGARTIARQAIADGVTTEQIDQEVYKFITKSGATPSFLHYGGFPASACISVNEELIRVTRQSFFEGIKFAKAGNRLGDISAAIQEYVERHGYSIVREYVGHGVGTDLHEAPEVPNYGRAGHGPRLVKGMTLAIEPMVNMGGAAIRVLDNDWTVVTVDSKLCAHYENTICITDGEPEILTMADDI